MEAKAFFGCSKVRPSELIYFARVDTAFLGDSMGGKLFVFDVRSCPCKYRTQDNGVTVPVGDCTDDVRRLASSEVA
jgi:hypothetical protein